MHDSVFLVFFLSSKFVGGITNGSVTKCDATTHTSHHFKTFDVTYSLYFPLLSSNIYALILLRMILEAHLSNTK